MSEPLAPASSPERDLPPLPDDPVETAAPEAQPFRWKRNLLLFVATVLSVLVTGAAHVPGAIPDDPGFLDFLRAAPKGWTFALPLMAILLTHEFGHYFAALYHRVPASLPYFLPMPLVSPFGTMGAVISMRGRIKSRNALLDIGASGPLAGLLVALPVLALGLSRSEVRAVSGPFIQEGQSLLYLAMKRIVVGPIPAGHDVYLDPVALAGWSGLFVTALNLIPVGQLDGGHIAYALFGARQNRYARVVHLSLLAMFLYNLAIFMAPVLWTGAFAKTGQAISNSLFWLVWFSMLQLMKRVSGADHPPTEPGELSPARKAIAVLSLVLFVLLFMPTPWAAY